MVDHVQPGYVVVGHRCSGTVGTHMNMDNEHQRSINAKIARLRERLKDMRDPVTIGQLRAVLLGILDLLGDEL